MAIYAVQGLYAVGCLAMAYPLYRWGFNPSFLSDPEVVLTNDKIKFFFRSQANIELTVNEIKAFIESVNKQKVTEDEKNDFINSQAKIGAITKDEIKNIVNSLINGTLLEEAYSGFADSQIKGALTGSEVKSFIRDQAKKMGIEKEIGVNQERGKNPYSYGNTWFSGKAGIELPGIYEETIWKFQITRELAHIKANDNLIIWGAVLTAALFITFVLAVNRDLFMRYLGGLGAGLITKVVVSRWAEKRADLTTMQNCSEDVNRAFLAKLLEAKQNGSGHFILCRPSLDERIGYFQAHLKSQKDGI